jgi:hypothetical protein
VKAKRVQCLLTWNPIAAFQTGSRRVVCNVWSDAAREASALARARIAPPIGSAGYTDDDLAGLAAAARQHLAGGLKSTGSKNIKVDFIPPEKHLELAGHHETMAAVLKQRAGGADTEEVLRHRADMIAHRIAAKHPAKAFRGDVVDVGREAGKSIASELTAGAIIAGLGAAAAKVFGAKAAEAVIK